MAALKIQIEQSDDTRFVAIMDDNFLRIIDVRDFDNDRIRFQSFPFHKDEIHVWSVPAIMNEGNEIMKMWNDRGKYCCEFLLKNHVYSGEYEIVGKDRNSDADYFILRTVKKM